MICLDEQIAFWILWLIIMLAFFGQHGRCWCGTFFLWKKNSTASFGLVKEDSSIPNMVSDFHCIELITIDSHTYCKNTQADCNLVYITIPLLHFFEAWIGFESWIKISTILADFASVFRRKSLFIRVSIVSPMSPLCQLEVTFLLIFSCRISCWEARMGKWWRHGSNYTKIP